MYNSWSDRKTPLMGFHVSQSWCSTLKRGLHNRMEEILTFPAPPMGGKSFNNPNFVNENNPSLLRHQVFYLPVTKHCEPVSDQQESLIEPPQQEMKKKRKRKRRNRKRNKKNSEIVKTEDTVMPELTRCFKTISVQPSSKTALAKSGFRTRVPSICESEDSFIVFEDRGADEAKESAIESDGELVIEGSTEVSENEGMSSDSWIPRKKVSFSNVFASLIQLFCNV